MMQGRYINHVALNAFNTQERVTMVTSYRVKDPNVKDESVLTTIRPISQLDEMYYQVGGDSSKTKSPIEFLGIAVDALSNGTSGRAVHTQIDGGQEMENGKSQSNR
jgi:hypothetical protein